MRYYLFLSLTLVWVFSVSLEAARAELYIEGDTIRALIGEKFTQANPDLKPLTTELKGVLLEGESDGLKITVEYQKSLEIKLDLFAPGRVVWFEPYRVSIPQISHFKICWNEGRIRFFPMSEPEKSHPGFSTQANDLNWKVFARLPGFADDITIRSVFFDTVTGEARLKLRVEGLHFDVYSKANLYNPTDKPISLEFKRMFMNNLKRLFHHSQPDSPGRANEAVSGPGF